MSLTPNTLFYRNTIIAITFGLLITLSAYYSEAIHFPFLVNIVLSIGIGWLEPKKGWILALVQTAALGISFFTIQEANLLMPLNEQLTRFAIYFAIFPTLAGSYMGGFLKRSMR